jgi:hypothetical protein
MYTYGVLYEFIEASPHFCQELPAFRSVVSTRISIRHLDIRKKQTLFLARDGERAYCARTSKYFVDLYAIKVEKIKMTILGVVPDDEKGMGSLY